MSPLKLPIFHFGKAKGVSEANERRLGETRSGETRSGDYLLLERARYSVPDRQVSGHEEGDVTCLRRSETDPTADSTRTPMLLTSESGRSDNITRRRIRRGSAPEGHSVHFSRERVTIIYSKEKALSEERSEHVTVEPIGEDPEPRLRRGRSPDSSPERTRALFRPSSSVNLVGLEEETEEDGPLTRQREQEGGEDQGAALVLGRATARSQALESGRRRQRSPRRFVNPSSVSLVDLAGAKSKSEPDQESVLVSDED